MILKVCISDEILKVFLGNCYVEIRNLQVIFSNFSYWKCVGLLPEMLPKQTLLNFVVVYTFIKLASDGLITAKVEIHIFYGTTMLMEFTFYSR
jgi:hypothetical protein